MSVDIIAACWTTAGAAEPLGADDRSPVAIHERIDAAAAAGFDGFGIRHGDLVTVEETLGFAEFRRLLDASGMRELEIEFLEGWYATGESRVVSDRHRADFLRAAETLGVSRIKVGCNLAGGTYDPDQVADELSALGDQAAAVGTIIGIEPMPFADIQTPTAALEIVVKADNKAVGVFLDLWHVGRAGIDVQTLADIPGQHIAGVELADADAAVRGTMLEDTVNHRHFPGAGVFDVPGFVKAVLATGYSGSWGVEMLSTEFRRLPVKEATQRAYDTTAQFLHTTN